LSTSAVYIQSDSINECVLMSIVIVLHYKLCSWRRLRLIGFQGKEVAWHEASKHELLFIIFFIAL